MESLAGKVALVFPGQGSQFVGMGKALYDASAAARRVFDQADEILEFPLSRLCFHGPADELEDTINAQPAILTVSIAALVLSRPSVLVRAPSTALAKMTADDSIQAQCSPRLGTLPARYGVQVFKMLTSWRAANASRSW